MLKPLCCYWKMETKGSGTSQLQVAPFVMKTYEMVNESKTDALIRWGRENNSFLVLDPSYFSQLLLPSYFKHSNFSSFVRQLNTYGFRKVDPDKWEFAHEAFLRGQIHLLPLIVRRKKRAEDFADRKVEFLEERDDETLVHEVRRLRQEQKLLDEELDSLSKRLQVTERRPQQMMSFILKVAEDPEFLPRFILSKKEQRIKKEQQQLKKRRVLPSTSLPSLPPLPQSLESGSCEITLSGEDFAYNYGSGYDNNHTDHTGTYSDNYRTTFGTMPIDQIGSAGGQKMIFSPEFGAPEEAAAAATATATTVAYPFSLLGNVFF